jgi:hypothetical protein
MSEDKFPGLLAMGQAASGSLRLAIQHLQRSVVTDMWDPADIRREMGAIDEVANLDLLTAVCEGKVDEKTFEYLLEEQDFDKVFKYNYSAISAAEAYKVFGVSTGIAYIKQSGYDDMNEKEKGAFQRAAQAQAFQIQKSLNLLTSHKNFPVVRDGFMKLATLFGANNYSNDIQQSSYILMLCEIARQCKTGQQQHLKETAPIEPPPTRVVRQTKLT